MLREYVIPPRDRWPGPISAALADIPPDAVIRASRYGDLPPQSPHNWFYSGLWLLAILGYGPALVIGLLGGSVAVALAICVVVGLIIGACLAIYRDYGGTALSPIQVTGLTAGAAGGLVFLARDDSIQVSEMIQWFLFLWLGSTIPILIGFYLTRRVMSRRRVAAAPAGTGDSLAKLSPDLDAATAHGPARVAVRIYPPDSGAALTEDRAALEPWGYDLREQVEARLETASPVLRLAATVVPEVGKGEQLVWALFLLRSPVDSLEGHP